MTSTKNVHDAHDREELARLHTAVLDIVAVMNRPQRDAWMLREAGVKMDAALFPLLVCVARFGPIGVVDLADRNGRNYTTVSRQVSRLEEMGLITRSPNGDDKRIRESILTAKGREVTDRIDAARHRIMEQALAGWRPEDVAQFSAWMRSYADGMDAVEKGDPEL